MNSAGMRTAFLLLLWAIAVTPLAAEFRVGTAKADITPPIGSRMYGYGARATNVSTGAHDPLFAKALVVSDGTVEVALVTLDLESFGADNTRRVRELVRRELDLEATIVEVGAGEKLVSRALVNLHYQAGKLRLVPDL